MQENQENNYDQFDQNDQNNNDQRGGNFTPRQPLGKKQKLAAAFLVVFAVAFLGLWIAQFKKNLKEPLTPKTGEKVENQVQEDSPEALKKKDTDKDGLSDWDELNVYQTSPYLEDSDSDGISDRNEILAGENPSCAKGQDCQSELLNASQEGADNALGDILNNADIGQINLNIGTSSQDGLEEVLGGQSDAASLRKMLLEAGMDPNMLNQISDEVLLNSYQEILNKQ